MKYVRVIRIILGLLLIFSGVAKIIDPSNAVKMMLDLGLLPLNLIIPLISFFPVVEIALGLLLIADRYNILSTSATLFLFTGFLFISIYGTMTGLNSDCGCFGSVIESRIGWGMIVRNGAFFIGACYIWIDSIKNKLSKTEVIKYG